MKKARIFLIFIITMLLVFSAGCQVMEFVQMFPKRPVIQHGEFPFCLTYEKDGKVYEVKDTLVCEYTGLAADAAIGFFRGWDSHLASGETRITLFQDEEIEIFYSPNISSRHAAAYYMGDHEIYDMINISFPDAWYTRDFENKQINAYMISADEMWEKYKIKLLSWEIAPPIKNTFK